MRVTKGLRRSLNSTTGRKIIIYVCELGNIQLFFRERIYQLERKEMEIEMEERKQVEEKKHKISEAARKADEPVDDSKLVEAMFDFLPDSSSEAPTPGGKKSDI